MDDMPNRILRESICRSETIDELSLFEENFFYRLLVNCDDYGRYDSREKILKSSLYPLKEGINIAMIRNAIDSLVNIGLIRTYEVEGREYIEVVNWMKYQQVRNKKSKYPAPIIDDINCNQLSSNDINCCSESLSESNPNTYPYPYPNSINEFQIPTVDEVRRYCQDRGNKIDAERFIDYYSQRKWVLDSGPVKDWKALVKCWETKDNEANEFEEKREGSKWQS